MGFAVDEREDLLGDATVMALIALPSFRGRSTLSTFFLKFFRMPSIEVLGRKNYVLKLKNDMRLIGQSRLISQAKMASKIFPIFWPT